MADEKAAPAEPDIERVKSGQKLAIYAILVSLAALATFAVLGEVPGRIVQVAGIVLSLVGIVQIGGGFHYSTGMKTLLVVLMFIPLISLLTLLRMNSKATAALRKAGYKVGLLGASGSPAASPPAA